MRIGINLLYLLPGIVGGTETYATELMRELAISAPEHEFIVFVNQEAAEWPLPEASNTTRVICKVTGSNRAIRYLYEQLKLPLLLRQWKIDLVHSLGYVGPIFALCPHIITIHDLNFIDLAQSIPFHRRFPLKFFSTFSAKNSDAVITVSKYSKSRIHEYMNLADGKIQVIYEAPKQEPAGFEPVKWQDLVHQYNIQKPYIVAFGGRSLHKNIITLFKAFAELNSDYEHYQLVVIGHLPANVDMAAIQKQKNLRGRVRSTGYVPDSHIHPLLVHAELLALPSLYEGFGLPVLEAQQANVPVVCSTAASLPEIAGDGAIFFDPTSYKDLARVMTLVLEDNELQNQLIRRGQENLQRFSWQKTALDTLQLYKNVYNDGAAH